MMVILRCLMINNSSRNEMTCLTPSICITALSKKFLTLACCLAKGPWAPFLLLLKIGVHWCSLIQHENCRRIVFGSAERLLLGWILEGRIWDDYAKSYIKWALSNRASISFVAVLFPLETLDVQASAEHYQQTASL